MRFNSPIRKLLRSTAALLIAAAVAFPALTAGARSLGVAPSAPVPGSKTFDSISAEGKRFDAELILSLEELKAQESDEEFFPSVWPVRFSERGYISSYFGYRIDPVTGESREFHGGIDLADIPNTKIHAAAAGIVVEAEDSENGFGLNILIDHGNGYQTRYSHCNSLLVDVGDAVRQGQVIATMGATGRVTGVHCDFRVYLDGTAIDPMTVLDEQISD